MTINHQTMLISTKIYRKLGFFRTDLKLVSDYAFYLKMLDEYVCFLGSVSSENVKEYYQKAMITVIPTIDQEGTSLSALESMSCGTPVVSTANGGLVDLPTLKSKTDAIDFANKIVELFGQYEQIKHQQQKETRDIFNMKNWTVAWSKVIEKAYI